MGSLRSLNLSLVSGQDPYLDARRHEVGHGPGDARLKLVLDRAGPDNLRHSTGSIQGTLSVRWQLRKRKYRLPRERARWYNRKNEKQHHHQCGWQNEQAQTPNTTRKPNAETTFGVTKTAAAHSPTSQTGVFEGPVRFPRFPCGLGEITHHLRPEDDVSKAETHPAITLERLFLWGVPLCFGTYTRRCVVSLHTSRLVSTSSMQSSMRLGSPMFRLSISTRSFEACPNHEWRATLLRDTKKWATIGTQKTVRPNGASCVLRWGARLEDPKGHPASSYAPVRFWECRGVFILHGYLVHDSTICSAELLRGICPSPGTHTRIATPERSGKRHNLACPFPAHLLHTSSKLCSHFWNATGSSSAWATTRVLNPSLAKTSMCFTVSLIA